MDSASTLSSDESQSVPSQPYMVPVIFDKEVEREHRMELCSSGDKTYTCIIAESERPELSASLKSLGVEVCYSVDGRTMPPDVPDECHMVFVCEDFEGPVYDYLLSRKFRIVGPPCVHACAAADKPLPNSSRPVYSSIMAGVVICFTGFKDKADLHYLCNLAHLMGASIRREMTSTVTHVVAHSVSGSKYKDAVALGTPIMSEHWILQCWENRRNIEVSATGATMVLHKQLPFVGCVVALYGFSQDEAEHMTEIAVDNGAVVMSMSDSGVTHVVVADTVEPRDVPPSSSRVMAVKQQWFWESIQIEACADETLYPAKEQGSRSSAHVRRHRQRTSLNSSLRSMGSVDVSLLEASLFSLSSPMPPKPHSKREAPHASSASSSAGAGPCQVDTARRHIASELLHTEKNFVDILQIVVQVFKEPLERTQQRGGPILSHEDIKSIFSNIHEILSVHRKLVASLEEQIALWSEATCIGNALLERSEDFLRAYPQFVNFFEMSKEALSRCDRSYPRFHAFLKANESRPECCRQTLAELLITPVQRIPRIILLLQDLVKHTDLAHPDYTSLQGAVESLKTVMNHINEDKRRTEGQVLMFEVLRDVDGCPATLLSSHRTFLRRLDVMDVGNPGKTTKADRLALFLFNDSIEIARCRPPPSSFSMKSSARLYKHLDFLPLSHVKSAVSFTDGEDVASSFGLLVRWPEDPQEKLLVFRLLREEGHREEIVALLAKLLAETNFSTDTEQFVIPCSSELLHSLSKATLSSRSFKRALHGASKRVRRAFSSRPQRKPSITSLSSVHTGLHGIGEENEAPPDSPDHLCSPNSSLSASTPTLAFTPVASLRTPKAKRQALSRFTSFSAADLSSNLESQV